MSRKRARCSAGALGGIDDVAGISTGHPLAASALIEEEGPFVCYSSHSRSQDDENDGEGSAVSSPVPQCRRVLYPSLSVHSSPTAPSAGLSVSTDNATDSLGGDEIDLLRRKDEEMADLALFLAKAVGEAPSPLSMHELLNFLGKAGIPRVLLALKRTEGTEAFVRSLSRAHPDPPQRVLLLRLFVELLECVEVEIFFHRDAITFLVESLVPSGTHEQAARSSPPSTRTAVHWSARKRRTPPSVAPLSSESPQSPSETRIDELDARAQALFPSSFGSGSSPATDATTTLLSLQALLTLAFRHHRCLLTSPSTSSFPLSFVQAGGLERSGELLLDTNARGSTLSLLEVLTALDVLGRERVRLLKLMPILVSLLGAVAQGGRVAVLKVLTNITNLLPSAFSETNTVEAFMEFMRCVLVPPSLDGDVEEQETFVLCCAINVVKYEAKEGAAVQPAFSRAFMACSDVLPAVARSMATRYHCSDAEQLVLSGYAALLLAGLSLVDLADTEMSCLRVPVMTAVAAALRGTRIGTFTDRQPMRAVAAIIQEFLLFQSAAGTLTKEALFEMDCLVRRVRQHNHIAVAKDSDKEALEDDDEVTLGDML
ncbi:hypothetical protein ABL78_2680 [Leptomonas seymouri]|uniref:Wings apart-like protein C-terminal domain-containing protein n=1 Tax=Leptomonas seymouri TaxID=5684 RepID=A0A0N0P709_LEPSE|nr:hypothetical protein ABL78_2680 [Leptomonas seymouri]|eukprot:KPI88256.1 hypothetical protein ABL78_2680 [Leptomonas seymouri]